MIRGCFEKINISHDEPFTAALGFKARTIPALFFERCHRDPHKVAFRFKELGIYREVHWEEYLHHVENFCLGLMEMGLRKGDTVAIIGDPCPEWMYTDIAAQCAGGISYGIHPTSSMPEVKYLAENGGAAFAMAADQRSADKIISVASELPQLRKIIVADRRSLFFCNDDKIISFKAVEEMGERRREKEPLLFEELISKVNPEDIATIIYTSGTTGVPKGAMISNYNILWGSFSLLVTFPDVLLNQKSRAVALLPMSHILGRLQDVYFPMAGGYTTHIGESSDTMAETIFDIAPTLIISAPRFFTKFAAQMHALIESSSYIKRKAYSMAMKIGRRYISAKWEGRVPWHLRLLYLMVCLLVFCPLLDKMGLRKVELAITSAAPVPPNVLALWQSWGMNLLELYCGTEFQGAAAQTKPFSPPGSCGHPLPRVECKVNEEGEILLRGPGIFSGYWLNEKATVKDIRNGWLHTADAAEILPDGSIRIRDRIGDFIITAGGRNLSPSQIEKAIKASPYISEVAVFGQGKEYPVALIEIDFDTVSEWARSHSIVYTSYTSLAQHPAILNLITQEVERGNIQLASFEQVKAFRFLSKELDPEDEDDPVTATRNIQRKRMYEKYKDLVESMYDDEMARTGAVS